jgi:ABC-type transport system substrate-binding protein
MSYGFTGQSQFAAEPGLQPGQPTAGLSSDQGLRGRQAFSLAINRTELANVGCARGLTCSPATGGYIAPGLRGSLGAGQDPWAPAGGDPSKAKAEYRKWDPDGSKVRNLRIEYNTSPQNDTIWQNVQAQLRQSLGVNLQLYPTDTQTWLSDLSSHQVALGPTAGARALTTRRTGSRTTSSARTTGRATAIRRWTRSSRRPTRSLSTRW